MLTRKSAIAEKQPIILAMLHADNGYSRRATDVKISAVRSFAVCMASIFRQMVPMSTVQEVGSLRDRIGVAVESCKIVFLGRENFLFTCLDTFAMDVSFSHNKLRHR